MRLARFRRIGAVALAFLGVWLMLRLRVAHERASFEAACARTAGASYEKAGAVFDDRGHVTVGLRMTSGAQPEAGSFTARPGWSARRFACAFDLADGRVVAPQVEVGHDLDSCSDRGAYPRRWWLCRLGRALIP